jgi:hypothetical protein
MKRAQKSLSSPIVEEMNVRRLDIPPTAAKDVVPALVRQPRPRRYSDCQRKTTQGLQHRARTQLKVLHHPPDLNEQPEVGEQSLSYYAGNE